MQLHRYSGNEIRAHRHRLNMTQTTFWGALGVTQSRGARYESGRNIPAPVMILLNLVLSPLAGDAALKRMRVAVNVSRPVRREDPPLSAARLFEFSTKTVDGAVDKRPAA